MEVPSAAELERAIITYLGLDVGETASEGPLYVKVGELERVKWPPDSRQFRGGLFVSVPFLGADRTKLDQAFARVSRGLRRSEILPGWRVEASKGKPFPHQDELTGTRLLTLPVMLTIERRKDA